MEIIGNTPSDDDRSVRTDDGQGGWLRPATGRRGHLLPRLWIAVAVLLVAVAVAAALFYRAELDAERRRTPDPTPAQQAAVTAVLNWAHALDTHDIRALDASIVADAGVLVIAPRQLLDQP